MAKRSRKHLFSSEKARDLQKASIESRRRRRDLFLKQMQESEEQKQSSGEASINEQSTTRTYNLRSRRSANQEQHEEQNINIEEGDENEDQNENETGDLQNYHDDIILPPPSYDAYGDKRSNTSLSANDMYLLQSLQQPINYQHLLHNPAEYYPQQQQHEINKNQQPQYNTPPELQEALLSAPSLHHQQSIKRRLTFAARNPTKQRYSSGTSVGVNSTNTTTDIPVPHNAVNILSIAHPSVDMSHVSDMNSNEVNNILMQPLSYDFLNYPVTSLYQQQIDNIYNPCATGMLMYSYPPSSTDVPTPPAAKVIQVHLHFHHNNNHFKSTFNSATTATMSA
eukprot:UN04726